jgi:ribonuclease-3
LKEVKNISETESPEEFNRRLNLQILDNLLLSRALTHRSYLNEHSDAVEDNERLEFLGDAVLDFIVGAWLYNRYPDMLEGELTRMRSALVHTEQLAEFAQQIDLGHAMRLGRGENQAGGKERPALLCDTFEAVVGAIYLDQGIDGVLKFISPFLLNSAEDILINHKDEDPKSKLQEWAQGKGFSTPQYITCSSSGPDHSKVFEVDVYVNGKVLARGNGHSKQAATKSAATIALQGLGFNSN